MAPCLLGKEERSIQFKPSLKVYGAIIGNRFPRLGSLSMLQLRAVHHLRNEIYTRTLVWDSKDKTFGEAVFIMGGVDFILLLGLMFLSVAQGTKV